MKSPENFPREVVESREDLIPCRGAREKRGATQRESLVELFGSRRIEMIALVVLEDDGDAVRMDIVAPQRIANAVISH